MTSPHTHMHTQTNGCVLLQPSSAALGREDDSYREGSEGAQRCPIVCCVWGHSLCGLYGGGGLLHRGRQEDGSLSGGYIM